MSAKYLSHISVASWNIQGIKSKELNKVEDCKFISEIKKHHIVALQETHCSPNNYIQIDGYCTHQLNRPLSGKKAHGGIAFLTGHSGAGKSTLLKLTAALEPASQGRVLVANTPLDRLKRNQWPLLRRRIGVVMQDHQLLNDRNIFDNVALPLQIAGYKYIDIKHRVQAALDKVGLLSRQNNKPLELSGGEQQRVGIARAVINRPKVLLADEPTGNLDPEMSMEIINLFRQFNSVGVTVLIATHDLSLLQRMGFPLLSLRAGQLIHNDFQNRTASV